MRWGQLTALMASLTIAASSAAAIKRIEQTGDHILFTRDNSLWSISAAGEEPERVLALPWPEATLSRLQVASDGSAVLINANGFTAWAPLSHGTLSQLRFLPCSGPSGLSEDGNRVVCATQDTKRIAVYRLRPTLTVEILDRPPNGPLFFAGSGNAVVAYGDQDGLLAIGDGEPRVLAKHRPDRAMAVTPDGKRAIGSYAEGPIHVVYAFRLDGKAIKRTLVHAARSLRISADSSWAAIQQELDACAVRIVGGQYMCWRRFQALDVSSEGHSLLVSRANSDSGHDLFLGNVRDVSSRKPTPVVQGVGRVAAFWRRPNLAAP